MSSTPPPLKSSLESSGERLARPATPTTCVFGDSTPFPYEGHFIETVRHAVDCGVALLMAQHLIDRAIVRVTDVDRARVIERARLEAMGGTIRRALANEMACNAERILRTGARIVDATRIAVEGEVAALESLAGVEILRARQVAADARAGARRAIETFLVHHDVPGTEIALRLDARDDRAIAEATLATPFGVEATFSLQIPEAHEWATPRRVGDVSPGTEIHAALESGLFFKKVAMQSVRLDRLFVSALRTGGFRTTLLLRKQPASGAGFKIDFDASGERTRVLLAKLCEDGTEAPEPTIELAGDDATHVLRLRQRIIESTSDLATRRRALVRASYDTEALGDYNEPRVIAERIVRCLAVTVREIARRSGAPGELVLRRDVRAGRRDEIYITTAELHEKVLTLPPLLRAAFDPFELDARRSPRAPAPSLPAYEDSAGEEEIEDVEEISRVDAVA